MGSFTYIAPDGTVRSLEVPDGTSVMQAAIANGVPGIVAECGGSQMCATCHVYVDEKWLSKLAPMQATEDAMLDTAASERKPNSRLSCQIVMSQEIDGLVVHMPERQV
ncbi:MAG: (2Fe-2S)-binding protein [Betaproteobacteria bacterium]|nr:(2Fe-2S)-binding protein [Betaproteobacteria bacterium]